MALRQTIAPGHWTYDDYAALDDGKRYEVIEGELFEMSAPRIRHQRIVLLITRSLAAYVDEGAVGEVFPMQTDVLLSPVNVVQPDVFFVSNANMDIVGELNIQGPPDLCVEILSPGNVGHDLRRKRDLYARFGVREYWLVDPERDTVTVLALEGGAYTVLVEATGDDAVRSLVLPEFASPAAAFFPAPA